MYHVIELPHVDSYSCGTYWVGPEKEWQAKDKGKKRKEEGFLPMPDLQIICKIYLESLWDCLLTTFEKCFCSKKTRKTHKIWKIQKTLRPENNKSLKETSFHFLCF